MLIQIHTKALQSFYHQMSQTKQPTNTAVITCITIIKNTLSTGFPVKRIFYPTQQSRIIFRSLPRSTMGILGSAIFLQAHSMVHSSCDSSAVFVGSQLICQADPMGPCGKT